jgi:hypothetical protein
MTENEKKPDLKTEIDESSLVGMLTSGPRKSGIVAQFMGRVNRRNAVPLPATMFIAPTGKAAAQLSQLSEANTRSEDQKLDEDLEAGILKPKFR